MKNKKSFILYLDHQELFEKLPDDMAGKLIKHIFSYVNQEDPTTDELLIDVAFSSIKQALKRDLEKWKSQITQRSEAGKRSAEKRAAAVKSPPTKSTSVESRSTKSTDSVNDSVSDSDSEKNKTLDQSAIDPELFEQFWLSGIRKVNKKKSLILFNNLLKKQPDPKDFTTKLIIDVKTRFDSNQLGFAEMHPTTYLNGERWNDEVKPHDQNQFRSNSGGHKLSVVERTRLANEERERARQARESHGPVMGAANGNLRPPVEQSVWPNDTGELGAIIDGDFTRSA